MFDLSLSEEQEQLVDSFRSLLQRECDPQVVREAEPLGHSPQLWKRMLDVGAAEMAVPEAAGGGGAGMLDAALVAEVVGRFLAPVPFVETTVANRLLARLGGDGAREALTAALGSGAVTTLALLAPSGSRLSWVPAGAVADVVVAGVGERIVVTSDQPPGEALPNLGCLPLAHRDLAAAHEVAQGPEAVAAFEGARDEWRILTAAALVGAGYAALELARSYTTERQAFGVPVASYQTVAHRLADLATALSGARLLARKAAWSVDRGSPDCRRLALMAFTFAAQTAEEMVTDALHFHGGYGFMLEYDIQLYLRRVKSWTLLNGDPRQDLQRLADEMWAPAAAV